MRRGMVAADATAARFIDQKLCALANGQAALEQLALVHDQAEKGLFGGFDHELAAGRRDQAGVANLAAGGAVKRRRAGHDLDLVARRRARYESAAFDDSQDLG